MKKHIILIAAALMLAAGANAQVKLPAASPQQTVKQDFALSYISLDYARPSVKGRPIFGDLVPYNALWRTGANAPTRITFGSDVMLNGNAIAAGEYLLFSIPNKDEWEIVFSTDLNCKNVQSYNPKFDALRFKAKTRLLERTTETFTIDIADMTSDSAEIQIRWEKTEVFFSVKADIDQTIMTSINEAMQSDNKPYYQGALYYYNTKRDLDQALVWINEAIKEKPGAYWQYNLKANILLEQKRYKEAIDAAKESTRIAAEAGNPDYKSVNDKIITQAESQMKKKKK